MSSFQSPSVGLLHSYTYFITCVLLLPGKDLWLNNNNKRNKARVFSGVQFVPFDQELIGGSAEIQTTVNWACSALCSVYNCPVLPYLVSIYSEYGGIWDLMWCLNDGVWIPWDINKCINQDRVWSGYILMIKTHSQKLLHSNLKSSFI